MGTGGATSGGEFTVRTVDGIDLRGRYWPAANTRAVMALVHGFGEHCGRYAHMAAHLNAKDISVVAVDLRGHGDSPGVRGAVDGYDDLRADLAALLVQTHELYPDHIPVLYGHSMGGGLVLDHGLSGTSKLRAIIASAPMIALPKPLNPLLRGAARLMAKLKPEATMPQPIEGDKVSTLPAEQKLYEDDPKNHGQLGFGLANGMLINGENIAAKAKSWHMPLLLMHSRDDQLTSFAASETFAKSAANTQFHAFENCAHEMHNDVPREQIYTLMTDFILAQAAGKTA